jgi:diguanylate cyclase (GGDEF)-like protein
VRYKEIRKVLFFSFLIPYLLIFLSGFFIIKYSFDNLKLVYDLKTLISPLNVISDLIFYLNEDKVLKALKVFGKENFFISNETEISERITKLQRLLKENNSWKNYCSCKEILNIDKTLRDLNRKQYTSLKELLISYDRLINQLCNYYSQLSSRIKLKQLSLELNTLYTLHKFWTVTSDFTAEKAVYLKYNIPFFVYDYYYYRGELIAYADTFYTLVEGSCLKSSFKRDIYESEFLYMLLERQTLFLKEFLKSYLDFKNRFRDFYSKVQNHFLEKLRYLENLYESYFVFSVISEIFVLTLISVLNFLIYLYGQRRFEKTLSKLELKIFKDPLTKLFNRRFFNLYMVKLLKNKYLSGEPVSFILFDLDHFKKINDTYGHAFGDKVLKKVADILRKTLRKNDVAVRWGGEEFAIFINGSLEDALKLARRLRETIENTPIDGVKITASFGVAEYRGEDPKEFFKKVDKALYRAKQKGRNRIEIAGN